MPFVFVWFFLFNLRIVLLVCFRSGMKLFRGVSGVKYRPKNAPGMIALGGECTITIVTQTGSSKCRNKQPTCFLYPSSVRRH